MDGAAKLVTIVIPCYNGERFVAGAIESCLNQTYGRVEAIVVDDASPDGCAAIAERYARADGRVCVINRATNGGVSRAFNSGFAVARGEYFTRLAQDDRFREDAVELMVNHLENHPKAGLVYCDMQTMDDEGQVTGRMEAGSPDRALEVENQVGLCVMWRRSVHEAIGGFDSRFDTAEDYEYWLRLAKHFPISKLADEAPFFFRFHDGMGSRRFQARQECAVYEARALHCNDSQVARRLRAEGNFVAAYMYREAKAHGRALRHIVAALRYDPLSRKNYRCLMGIAVSRLREIFAHDSN